MAMDNTRLRRDGFILSAHSIAVTVDAPLQLSRILERTGAQDVASTGEASADWQKSISRCQGRVRTTGMMIEICSAVSGVFSVCNYLH
jgi:hypothetical protein